MSASFTTLFFLEHIMGQRTKDALAQYRNHKFPLIPHGFSCQLPIRTIGSAAEARQTLPHTHEPLLWKGGARGTRLDHWNLAYLKDKAGDTPVKILALSGLKSNHSECTDQVMPLSQYIALMKRRNVYLRFSDLLDNCPRLKADLPIETLNFIAKNPGRINLQFFLGAAGAQTPLHAELNCNIFIQVFGRKRWLLFPVSATEQLQVPSAGRFYFFSPLDPLKKRRQRAMSDSLRGWDITLEAGDILLCPPFLWHAVENLTPSCSVGFKYNKLFQAFRASPLLFAMNLLARNPSYPSYIWQAWVRKRHPILATK